MDLDYVDGEITNCIKCRLKNNMTYFDEFIYRLSKEMRVLNCIRIISTTTVTKCATLGNMQAAVRKKLLNTKLLAVRKFTVSCRVAIPIKKRTSAINSRFIVVTKFQCQFLQLTLFLRCQD